MLEHMLNVPVLIALAFVPWIHAGIPADSVSLTTRVSSQCAKNLSSGGVSAGTSRSTEYSTVVENCAPNPSSNECYDNVKYTNHFFDHLVLVCPCLHCQSL